MSLIDSLDSILMLYAYAQPGLRSGPNRRFLLFAQERKLTSDDSADASSDLEAAPIVVNNEINMSPDTPDDTGKQASLHDGSSNKNVAIVAEVDEVAEERARILEAKTSTISSLSISLTLLSIAVALSISLIQIMGLIGENCTPCTEAAEDPSGGGLAGSWWRAWARVSGQHTSNLTAGKRRERVCWRSDCGVFCRHPRRVPPVQVVAQAQEEGSPRRDVD